MLVLILRTILTALVPTSPLRTYAVAPEVRRSVVSVESRRISVAPENRIILAN